MDKPLIIILIILAIIIFLVLFAMLFYFFVLPKILIKKIRGGEEQLTFPDNFDSFLKKVNIEHLEYTSAYPNSTFDLYTPKNKIPKAIVIWIHGGFFIAGDKYGVSNVCTIISASNYLVAAINYAIAPENKYPTAILQTDEFIKYFHKQYPEYAQLPIIMAGDSAGGHIALQYSLVVTSISMQEDMQFIPYLSSNALKGLVLVCAPIDLGGLAGSNKKIDFLLGTFGRVYFGNSRWHKKEKYKASRLFNYIKNNFPPTFLTDGNAYSFEKQNRRLGEEMRKNCIDVEELYFNIQEDQVNHEYLFDMKLPSSEQGMEQLINFLNRISLK